ncbi:MAG: beta-lactamase family protein [Chloracidobacterium sp.]|nr:beta-lactamase family protein [Chloracidobacterium sp.]
MMLSMRSVITLFLLVVCPLGGHSQVNSKAAVSGSERIKKIDDTLSALVADGFDGVIFIKSKDTVLLHKAYGFADRASGRTMKLDTGFDIGSLVKPFTKAAILKLQERGKLSTSDTLSKYFKSVPEDKAVITIDQIIRHTAGLPDSFGSDYAVMTADELLAKVLAASLVSKPGEKRNYSNSGYSLLAMIIEKRSGKPYEEFVRKEIFEPAGVRRIGYSLAGWRKADLAVGSFDGKPWGTPLDKTWAKDGPYWNLRGNGGMLATAEETSRWFEAVLDGKVLGPAALKEFLDSSSGISQTLGLRVVGVVGGNNVFNSLQYSVIEPDFHFQLASSNSKQAAEDVWLKFRDELFALAKESSPAVKNK